MTPPQVDAMELWEVASMLGRNRAPEREPWPDDAPAIGSVRRSRARSMGLPNPGRDDPIGAEEYAELLAMVKGGKRTKVGE